MEGKGEISSDSSAVMLELFHMEMVSLFSSLDHKECQVSIIHARTGIWQGNAQSKLEQLGRRVGATMAEQMTRDIPRFKNELDVLVFVCKQFWQQAWHKPVDNLKTNHQVRVHVVNVFLPRLHNRTCTFYLTTALDCCQKCQQVNNTSHRQL